MPITIRDEGMAAELAKAVGPEEVRGPDGRVLGQFTPIPRSKMTYPESGLTDEELDQRLNDPNAKWYTADEVMARLRELG